MDFKAMIEENAKLKNEFLSKVDEVNEYRDKLIQRAAALGQECLNEDVVKLMKLYSNSGVDSDSNYAFHTFSIKSASGKRIYFDCTDGFVDVGYGGCNPALRLPFTQEYVSAFNEKRVDFFYGCEKLSKGALEHKISFNLKNLTGAEKLLDNFEKSVDLLYAELQERHLDFVKYQGNKNLDADVACGKKKVTKTKTITITIEEC